MLIIDIEILSNVVAIFVFLQFLMIVLHGPSRKKYVSPMTQGDQQEVFRFIHIVTVIFAVMYLISRTIEKVI